MKRTITLLITVSPVLVIILVITEILFANNLASFGSKIHDIDDRISSTQNDNALLATEVASASSLLTIQDKATEFGFIEPAKTQFVTLTPEQAVAYNKP